MIVVIVIFSFIRFLFCRRFFVNLAAVNFLIRCKYIEFFQYTKIFIDFFQDMSSFIDRLSDFMQYKGINDNQMTVAAGLSVGLLGKAKSGGKGMSSSNIEKILLAYPELSPTWLLTGGGEMLQDGALARESINSDMHIERIETRPRIPLEAAAGSLSIITQSVSEYDCESFPVISRFPKYDFTIMVKGDSMEPEFCSGDEIACRFIERPSFIQWGRPHVLDTNQGVILKKIYNRPNSILCKSINKEYDDFEVPKDGVFHVALVVGSIRLF